jgi:hypothetical protein
MAIPRIQVKNYNALGDLFIEWALGKTKRPTDLAGFIAQVVPDIVAPLPYYIETFECVQSDDKKHLLLRLPPAELVQDTIDSIKNRDNYFLPDFYKKRLDGNILDDRDFFSFRVGDYTIAHCS